jgi:hypothetical protein
MIPLALSALGALAAPERPTEARAVKIDLYSTDPQAHPWGSDWRVAEVEQWTAVLACHREERVEHCLFVDGVWWSVVVAGSDRVSVHLPAPGELAFAWSRRGTLRAWDVVGDRSAFWAAASDAALAQLFQRPNVGFTPDAQREIGAGIEEALARGLAAALEWELPARLAPGAVWAATRTPWVARRWLQSTSSPRLVLAVSGTDGDRFELQLRGTVVERVMEGGFEELAAVTAVAGTATLDPQAGIVRAWVEAVATPTNNAELTGHARSVARVEPWSRGFPTAPADLSALGGP